MARSISTVLLAAGATTVGIALVWWVLTFWQVWSYDYLPLAQAGKCLLAGSTICRLATALCTGQHRALVGVYSPVALWIGAAAFIAGLGPHAWSRIRPGAH